MKGLIVAALLAVSVFVGVEQFAPADAGFASVFADTVQVVAPVKVSYARGITTLQGQPCDDSRGGVDYRSEIISRDELAQVLTDVGFQGRNVQIMSAIAMAESGNQENCFGDENLVDAKWGPSRGLFQIRTLVSAKSGDCRNESFLMSSITQQAECAFLISSNGANFRPWSTFLNGKYKRWLT